MFAETDIRKPRGRTADDEAQDTTQAISQVRDTSVDMQRKMRKKLSYLRYNRANQKRDLGKWTDKANKGDTKQQQQNSNWKKQQPVEKRNDAIDNWDLKARQQEIQHCADLKEETSMVSIKWPQNDCLVLPRNAIRY